MQGKKINKKKIKHKKTKINNKTIKKTKKTWKKYCSFLHVFYSIY